jgi:hypothetical protein
MGYNMSKLETVLTYKITSCEEAAFLLSKYFIERNYEADVIRQKDNKGAFCSLISRHGLVKNFLGSRTVFEVTFFPKNESGKEYTGIQIESKMADGLIKEIATYVLILPAVKKLSDYAKMLNICKTKSVEICEKLKIN